MIELLQIEEKSEEFLESDLKIAKQEVIRSEAYAHEFMNTNLAEDEQIFYNLGIENGKKEAREFYSLNNAPFKNSLEFSNFVSLKNIYQDHAKDKLIQFYQEGFSLGYYYNCSLLDNYYKNYLKAYRYAKLRNKNEIEISATRVEMTLKRIAELHQTPGYLLLAKFYPEPQIVVTLSQQLSWSHFCYNGKTRARCTLGISFSSYS